MAMTLSVSLPDDTVSVASGATSVCSSSSDVPRRLSQSERNRHKQNFTKILATRRERSRLERQRQVAKQMWAHEIATETGRSRRSCSYRMSSTRCRRSQAEKEESESPRRVKFCDVSLHNVSFSSQSTGLSSAGLSSAGLTHTASLQKVLENEFTDESAAGNGRFTRRVGVVHLVGTCFGL